MSDASEALNVVQEAALRYMTIVGGLIDADGRMMRAPLAIVGTAALCWRRTFESPRRAR